MWIMQGSKLLQFLLINPQLCHEIGRKALAYVEEYFWKSFWNIVFRGTPSS